LPHIRRNHELIDDPVRNKEISAPIPAKRWGQPEDLEGTVIFLASKAPNYLRGAVILVDGG
jgi:2-deoxy-D-gluconate 3-dehydrogenase